MTALGSLIRLGDLRGKTFAPALAAGSLAIAVYTAAQVALPVITGRIVDDALLARNAEALARLSALLVAAAFLSTLAKGVYTTAFTWVGERARSLLQVGLMTRLYRRSQSFFDGRHSGRLLSLLTEDAGQAARGASNLLSESLLGGAQLLLILWVLAAGYGRIVLAAFVLIPLYMLFPLVFNRPSRRIARASLDTHAEVHTALQESLQGVRELRVLGREAWSLERLRRLLADDVGRRLRLDVLRSVYAFQYAVYFLVAGLVYWFGGLRVLAGEITVGELVALVALMAQLEGPVGRLTRLSHEHQRLAAAVERLEDFGTAVPAADAGGEELPRGAHEIVFENVGLTYDGAEGPALEGVSFRIPPGRRVAIVGPSGAGKSSLVGLLARLYEPGTGRITLDGRPLERFRTESLREQLGVVLQEAMLFAGTVRENLRIARLDADDGEIAAAARAAHAHDFISALPEGYDTEIGERGARLSGGQRQRIGIARALLRDPTILVLDEATSALDAESEHRVREALERLMAGRTTLIVAHRSSSFVDADEIVVLDEGRLAARGRHDELLAASELYRKLASATPRGED